MTKIVETEKNLDAHIVARAKAHGGKAIKLTSSHYTGLPDRLILLPGNRVFFIEVKGRGKKPTPHQVVEHKAIQAIGFDVFVVDSFESLDAVLPKEFKEDSPIITDNMVPIAKAQYKSKDGVIKQGVLVDGVWFAPLEDLVRF